jgi:hypothetical protein
MKERALFVPRYFVGLFFSQDAFHRVEKSVLKVAARFLPIRKSRMMPCDDIRDQARYRNAFGIRRKAFIAPCEL